MHPAAARGAALLLRRSPLALSVAGIALAAVLVVLSLGMLRMQRDTATPAELTRVFMEVEAMQDEDEQLVNELRISESEDSLDSHQHIARHVKIPDAFAIPEPDDPMASGRHLITTYFRNGGGNAAEPGGYSTQRSDEILKCLSSNLANSQFTKVHVLYEGEPPPAAFLPTTAAAADRLVLVKVTHQPTYLELFSYANARLRRGALAVIANADIYFDKSLSCLQPVTPDSPRFQLTPRQFKRPFFALTRRHAPECGAKPDYKNIHDLCDSYIGSHDVFIFAVPVAERIIANLNHTQNAGLGAENVVVWELNHSGEWRGINPCDLILAYHLHCSQERTYSVLGEDSKLVFVSRKGFNGAPTRRHGYIKPWHLRKTVQCPFVMF